MFQNYSLEKFMGKLECRKGDMHEIITSPCRVDHIALPTDLQVVPMDNYLVLGAIPLVQAMPIHASPFTILLY